MPKLAAIALVAVLAGSALGRQDPSVPLPLRRPDRTIQNVVRAISEDRIAATLKKLESFETRNTMSDPNQPGRGVGAARQWIFDELKGYSPRLQVRFDTHLLPKEGRLWKEVEIRNVLAVLPGKSDPDRWILVAGHYDSLNLRLPPGLRDDPAKAAEAPAPGVTDNGSGTACAMECARVLSEYEFDATLVFAAFAGEEQGLVGARALAQELKASDRALEGILNNDIIGSDRAGNGVMENRRILVFSEDPDDSPSRQLARFIKRAAELYYPEFGVDMVFRYDRFGRGGDHTPFNQAGYAGVRLTSPVEHYANQHSTADTFANTSVPYIAKVTRLNAAAAAALALAPRPPVTAPGPAGLGRGSGYDAVLRWTYPYPAQDLAGFMVVVRGTTAPDWEREIWAGNVGEFTMANTPIDQLAFGVKAVDRDGHESPATAYVVAPPRR